MTAAAVVRRVLIIEDCVEDALLLGLAFEDHAPGVEVQAVSDGASGVAYCQSPDPPQVVVLDLHLPGQTGLEILMQLRLQASVPVQVVCWSSHAHPAEVQAILDHGAVAYVEKPKEVTGFGQLVQSLLTL
ncbi:response regulator [Deinococcus sp. Arct2-2]|uniref:response regulator transcription factor n=1 Tax=Deinococcus sp. Arct2-2 TaxID=2568653 RepID=UPI0010A41337|nr:response regulator [Deinococcus sp. Arct2-2]THF70225.1 response regulator [Deinococcus sp. Arct2-2]